MSEFPWEEEEALPVETVPVTPAPARLRDCLALVGPEQELDPSYPVGQFEIPIGEPPTATLNVAVVAVAELDDKVVVAVPFNSWHRTVARRILPSGSLLKPLPLTVDLVDRSLTAGEEPRHFETAKIWMAVLAPSFEACVVFEEDAEISPDYQFSASDPALCPSVESLAAAYQQHFAFVSAASGAEPARAAASGSVNPLEDRLKTLEQSVHTIAVSLQQLTGAAGGTAAPLPPKTSAGCPPPGLTTQAIPVASPPGLFTKAKPGVISGDSDIVSSARLAGVPEHQIQEMLKLATKGRMRMGDLPQDKRPGQRGAQCAFGDRGRGGACPRRFWVGSRRSVGSCSDKANGDCQSLDPGEEEEQDLGSSTRRCWFGRIFREWSLFGKQEVLGCSESPSQCLDQAARASLQSFGKEYAGRFLQGLANAGLDSCAGERKGMVGIEVASPRVSDPCPFPLGDGRGVRRPHRQSCRGSTSSLWADTSHGGPDGYRPRVVDHCWRNRPGRTAADGSLLCPYASYGGRAASHAVDRSAVAGVDHGQDLGCRQPAGEEETAGSSTQQSRLQPRGGSSCSSWCKGKRKRRKRGERKGEARCSRRSRSAARTAELMQDGAARAEAIGAGCRASTTGLSPGVVLRDDGIIPGSGIRTDGKAAVKAPGADASTVDVDTLWNSMTRWLLTSRSQQLRRFVHSSFLQQDDGAQSTRTPRPVWPIPLPYRGKLHSGTAREKSFARALNLFVICMNWLHLGQPSKPPRDFNPYASLTSEQIGIVKRLKLLALEWKNSMTVTAEDMGRSAGKFEQLEKTLGVLTQRAMVLVRSGGSGNMRTPHVGRHPPGGSATLLSEVSIAKEIESQRLQFRGVPSFDPTNLLDEETRNTYVDPVAAAISPEESCQDPPFVQVRGRRTEIMKLFQKLDQGNRLALFTEEQVRMQYRSGLFALMKDLEKDRLILDARPANQLEFGLTTWTSTMGSVVPLLSLQLLPEQVLACSGEDLRDYYYYFCISPARALRNAIRYELTLEEAKQFAAYGKAVPGRRRYIPALNTMAMGDINAVEVGQEAHVKLAFRAGVRLSDLITLRGRLPRGGPYVGIVIDDFITISAVPRPLQDTTEAAMLADKMVEIYGTAGLLAHDGKRFRDALHAKFWGASLDGEAGTLRFQLEKVLPLAMLTSQLARLGWSNRKLLEVLSGAWIAALQCRRRCMCLLEVVFDEIQLHGYEENFPLSPAAIDELDARHLLPLVCD